MTVRSAGKKKNVDVHRYVCELAHGRPSLGKQAAHSCGVKLCANPNHLRWATARENMADARRHGTLRGGGRYRQRIFQADVLDIVSSSDSLLQLAQKYNSDPAYISKLRREHGAHR